MNEYRSELYRWQILAWSAIVVATLFTGMHIGEKSAPANRTFTLRLERPERAPRLDRVSLPGCDQFPTDEED